MGQNGHIASELLKDSESKMKRIILLFSILKLDIKCTAIIVSGHQKHDIVDSLAKSEKRHVNDYPILEVNSQSGNVTFHIYNDAWFRK